VCKGRLDSWVVHDVLRDEGKPVGDLGQTLHAANRRKRDHMGFTPEEKHDGGFLWDNSSNLLK
jgi:hypothetical protein